MIIEIKRIRENAGLLEKDGGAARLVIDSFLWPQLILFLLQANIPVAFTKHDHFLMKQNYLLI